MKRFIFAFVAIVCFGLSTAMAQNTNANPAITQFVTQYFPEATIQMVMPDEDDIDVVLNDYTKIEFKLNNEWKKVDCEHATKFISVPATLVSEQITAYVNANFPNTIIKKLEKKFFGWEIELSNGLEVKFNNNFKVTKVDD
ncbi:MAG: PepSY-like domain-containing protein [Bacteroidales bacterium]|nr:PepSY-like domain-containing protein [Bacteroidales bacterium]